VKEHKESVQEWKRQRRRQEKQNRKAAAKRARDSHPSSEADGMDLDVANIFAQMENKPERRQDRVLKTFDAD